MLYGEIEEGDDDIKNPQWQKNILIIFKQN